jgi:hypothetical protein
MNKTSFIRLSQIRCHIDGNMREKTPTYPASVKVRDSFRGLGANVVKLFTDISYDFL